ncbi:myb domain protein 3r-4 [Striga asiatica]|uniref:Myb domain protein 3r-4 n=1 Tax=Striga asiatica TaxID=4170 RepID=A0A5A7PTR7_STRAF|nr:myb domain protein 3r-4 [Striga asiatica]
MAKWANEEDNMILYVDERTIKATYCEVRRSVKGSTTLVCRRLQYNYLRKVMNSQDRSLPVTAEAQNKRRRDDFPECSHQEKKQELGMSSQDELMEVELIEGSPATTKTLLEIVSVVLDLVTQGKDLAQRLACSSA